MSDWKRAVVRVWHGKPTGGQGEFKGTAFRVSSDKLCTAKHVVEDIPESKIFLAGPSWSGVR